jgi:hypothetical protein
MTGIVESSFKFRKVLNMPAQAGVWTEHARKVMSLTQCAMDLSEEQKTEILRYDNGAWDTNDIVHWCLPECPCGGSRQGALRKIKVAVMMSLGAGCELALEYRWKNMERGLGWVVRGRSQHGLLDRSLKAAFSKKDIETAARQVQAAANDDAAIPVGSRHTVKAGKVLEFMETGLDSRSLCKALIFVHPLQRHLKNIFKAEAMTTNFTQAATRSPSEPDQVRDRRLTELLQSAADHNRPVLSGEAGRQIARQYAALLADFNHEGWSCLDMKLSRSEKHEGSLLILSALGAAWRRCVFYLEQPKFRVLAAADSIVSPASRRELVEGLRRAQVVCSKCVDAAFTGPWIDRLLSDSAVVAERAVGCLEVQVAATPVSSVRVEKKHLLGQEMRTPKSRGAALSASELCMRTYEKAVADASTFKSEAVVHDVLGDTTRRSFSRLVSAAAVEKRGVQDTQRAARARVSSTRTSATALSAWGEHRRVQSAMEQRHSPRHTRGERGVQTAAS